MRDVPYSELDNKCIIDKLITLKYTDEARMNGDFLL